MGGVLVEPGFVVWKLTAIELLPGQESVVPSKRKWRVRCACGELETRIANEMTTAKTNGTSSACKKCLRSSRSGMGRRRRMWMDEWRDECELAPPDERPDGDENRS
jgi:hypothetical protein